MRRKVFLEVVAAGTAATLNFLYPGIGKAATPGGRMGHVEADVQVAAGPDPTYAGGTVVSKTSNGLILSADNEARAVRLAPDTVVWKELNVTPDAINIGDWVDVKGTPLSDGSLQARSGWVFVNIARRDGIIQQVSPTQVAVTDLQQNQPAVWHLSTAIDFVHTADASPIAGGLAQLTPGTAASAVGIRLPDGTFRATRLWW